MEALRAVREVDYDIVFMDCQMPVMDGFEATRAIRRMEQSESGKRRVIIALTAHVMEFGLDSTAVETPC